MGNFTQYIYFCFLVWCKQLPSSLLAAVFQSDLFFFVQEFEEMFQQQEKVMILIKGDS